MPDEISADDDAEERPGAVLTATSACGCARVRTPRDHAYTAVGVLLALGIVGFVLAALYITVRWYAAKTGVWPVP